MTVLCLVLVCRITSRVLLGTWTARVGCTPRLIKRRRMALRMRLAILLLVGLVDNGFNPRVELGVGIEDFLTSLRYS